MTEAVIDNSALIELFIGKAPHLSLRWWAVHRALAAPEVIDLEAAQTLRGLTASGKLDAVVATRLVDKVATSPIDRVPHRALLARIWQLRANATAYDAAYLALAERLDVPLLTCDAKLDRVPGHQATVVFFDRS
ncbi:type II toxin-antitoxin system VapC family toxin [Glycomyces dulcitolivorans]|jgi:predicted nucleic acid-binding protein|uniref:type II toxin-antitoxin system VapC family toxin n=1 Tax=Glycomyces dulcitolivorans TaxID=2200759 RepID=UPI000DD47B6C|nr:PIN domain-containing protein [Glycomyces dulcitolivorans]